MDAFEALRKAIRNIDARKAIVLARGGACSRAGRQLDRARDLRKHPGREQANEVKMAAVIVRQLCPQNKEVAKATYGLRGSHKSRRKGRR